MNPENKSESESRLIRYLLGIILAFLAAKAFGGGIYGMMGAEGVPLELLEGSPFKTYFIPSLILFAVVGGSFLFASVAVFLKVKYDRKASVFSALVVLVWLGVQVAIIGQVSWMQPATAIAASVILVFSYFLPSRKN